MAWTPALIFLLVAVWLAWALLVRWLVATQPRRELRVRLKGSPHASAVATDAWTEALFVGALHRLTQAYCLMVHGVSPSRAEGREHIPDVEASGLIVVVNHTAGIDPLLVQACLPFEVRWMMGNDMRWGGLDLIWNFLRIIGVDRDTSHLADAGPSPARERRPGDAKALREAVRHVKHGGVLGIFPEGRIQRHRGVLLPFHEGVGMIASLSGAPVLPVFIADTPACPSAWASLWKPSRSRVRFGGVIRPAPGTRSPEATAAIRAWFASQA